MKALSSSTLFIVTGILTLGAWALPAWGQGGNPPASTEESGRTSGHGMTAAEQTAKGKGGNVEQQIRTLHEQARQAALKGDTSWQEKYLADNFVGIGGDGRMITKDQAIQMRKSGALKYEAIDEHDVKVRVYGGAAIVNSSASLKATLDGTPINGAFRATFVYVQQNGNWREASFQGTPVMPIARESIKGERPDRR